MIDTPLFDFDANQRSMRSFPQTSVLMYNWPVLFPPHCNSAYTVPTVFARSSSSFS